MKQLLLSLGFLLLTCSLFSQHFVPVPKSSAVNFHIKNFGLTTDGNFGGLKGEVYFNPKDLENASIEMSVEANTVFTKNRKRDEHLMDEEFFYAEKYPTIYITSNSITAPKENGLYTFDGSILMRGITKKIQFEFSAKPQTMGYLFEGSFKINRKDFGVGRSYITMSEEVKVDFSISVTRN
ncbi:MAG: YceI family protein [Chitinophagaceae bacterium]|nr:YceI family protein [Chitinophagaceae bacterium]